MSTVYDCTNKRYWLTCPAKVVHTLNIKQIIVSGLLLSGVTYNNSLGDA